LPTKNVTANKATTMALNLNKCWFVNLISISPTEENSPT